MNKVSSKLAAGMRKVKAQHSEVRPAEKTPAPAAPKKSAPASDKPRTERGCALHPARVWPD